VVFPKLFARPRYAVAIATCALLLAMGGQRLWTQDHPKHHDHDGHGGMSMTMDEPTQPVLAAFGSALLLFHEHHTGMHGAGDMSTMARIQAEHLNFALTGFGIGAFRGLSEVPTRWQLMYARLWPLLMIVLGILLVLYRESIQEILNQTPMLQNTVNSQSHRPVFCLARNACRAIALTFLFWASPAFAQISTEDAPRPIVAPKQVPPSEQVSCAQIESDLNDGQQSSGVTTSLDARSLGSTAEVKQSKRILWIFPNTVR